MHSKITLREVKPSDLEKLVALFKETVHTVNAKDYTPAQLDAWAASTRDHNDPRWRNMLSNIAFLAEIDNVIVGFIDLTRDGYLDRLYVHKDYQRQGIASVLWRKIEEVAKELGLNKIEAEVSITAKPLAEAFGARVVKVQDKVISGVVLRNFVMEKSI